MPKSELIGDRPVLWHGEPIFILLSDWYNKCLNEKNVVVLIRTMAVIRFLCKRQVENVYLSSSPGSSAVGAAGAAVL